MNGKFLITGGAGFIGSHIAEYLVKNKAALVRVIDNLSTGKKENIQHLLKYKNFEFVEGDITDYNLCLKVTENIDYISHQAALGSVPRSIIDPLATNNNNITGFLSILKAAKENGIKRFVFASSSSVYGDNNDLPKKEENIGAALSPYAITKYVNELYANVFGKLFNMECIGLRYFNIFGPRQDPNGPYAAVIPKFIDLIEQGKSPVINGDGSFSRDFTFVSNAVDANILAMLTTKKEAIGKTYNIAASCRVTILELFNKIKKLMNSNIEPIFGKERLGDVPHSYADISLAKELLGYNPVVNVDDGLSYIVNSKLS